MKLLINIYDPVLGSNPFWQAFILSDWLGKGIFFGLYLLSIISWIILIVKWRHIYAARKQAQLFRNFLLQNKTSLLQPPIDSERKNSPFHVLHATVRKYTVDLLNKNRQYAPLPHSGSSYLSSADLDFIHAHLDAAVAVQVQHLDSYLFILSTTVSLAPFLGLLGTVWGILITFSGLQGGFAATNQTVLSGLSLALATTVLGLLDAIPALVGYNYLKNGIRRFQIEMENFSIEILSIIQMNYRKVE